MAEVSLPPGLATSSVNMASSEPAPSADLYDPLNMEPALVGPDPGFVFPPRENAAEEVSKVSAQSEAGESSKPAVARNRPDHISINKLPSFAFPAPVTPPATQSGNQSPTHSMPVPRPGGGHRRGGSEFIGGDGSMAGPGLMSASPTKTEGALPSPAVGGRRRGHAHRRSGAISSHDLSAILKPADPNKSTPGSAPTTPSHLGGAFTERPMLGHAASQPTLPRQTDSPTHQDVESPSETGPPPAQPRVRQVGFSDKVDIIPRPLSTISSATSSSMSTIRPMHASTGSITSLPSLTGSSPPSGRKTEQFRSSLMGGADNNSSDLFRLESGPTKLFQRPSTPVSSKASTEDGAKEQKAFDGRSSKEAKEQSQSSYGKGILAPSAFSDLNDYPAKRANFPRISSPHNLRPFEAPRPRSSPEAKVSKSQKKSKPWTGLLSRRHRQHGTTRAPAQLGLHATSPSDFSSDGPSYPEDVDFDNDTTCVVVDENHRLPRSAPANRTQMFNDNEDSDDEVPGAVLDLDEEWRAQDAAQARSKALQKRQLHSTRGFGGFPGSAIPGHRRAESAPVMPAFDNAFMTYRPAGSPQMADVFEEDENEDHASPTHGDVAVASGASAKEGSFESKTLVPDLAKLQLSHSGSQQGPGRYNQAVSSEATKFDRDVGSADTKLAYDGYSPFVSKPSGDLDVATPPIGGDTSSQRPLALFKIPDSSYDFADMAAEPSPDPAQTSFEVPRLSTGHSSVTDKSAWSSARTGDSASAPFNYSTDDVAPSWTSVSSTRTGPPYKQQPPSASPLASPLAATHPPAEPRLADRPYRGSVACTIRTECTAEGATPRPHTGQKYDGPRPFSSAGKRASLASLSRLMGGSSRSKLSVASHATEGTEESEAASSTAAAAPGTTKKKNRISRLVRFFKSRENLKAGAEGGNAAGE